MVEKKPPHLRENRNEPVKGSNDHSETSFHKRNLYLASLPLLASFALVNYFSRIVFLVFQFLWKHIPEIRGCILPFRRLFSRRLRKSVNSNIVTVNAVSINMSDAIDEENELLKQKIHHRKAFEYISQALKIDEENPGNSEFLEESYIANLRTQSINDIYRK